MREARVVNIADVIEKQPIGRLQVRVFVMCCLLMFTDGFDAQALGYLVPAISKDWHVAPATFAPAFSAGLIGMVIGALVFGSLADAIGRRKILVACTAFFGGCTLLIAGVSTMQALIALRFCAGLALGGCIPNALAMASEYSPARLRATMVMLTACGISLGSASGGIVAGAMVRHQGWRIVFEIGGVLPLALALLVLLWLPESIRYLALRKPRSGSLAALMRRLCPRIDIRADSVFVSDEGKTPGLTVRHLFTNKRAWPTLLLWFIYFMCLLEIYSFASWLPTILSKSGVPIEWSVYASSSMHVSSMIAGLMLGWFVERTNPGRVLCALYLGGAVAVLGIGAALDNHYWLMVATFCAGFGLGGGQGCSHAIASRIYPTFMRSTGMGWALGIGRVGSVIGPMIGGVLLAMDWQPAALLWICAVPAVLAGLASFLLSFSLAPRASADAGAESIAVQQASGEA